MALCRGCIGTVPFGTWWCPNCGLRSEFAPAGADRQRPPGLVPSPDPAWYAAYDATLRRRRRRRQAAGGIAAVVLVLLAVLLAGVVRGGTSAGVSVPLTFDQKPFGNVTNPPPIARVVIGKNHAIPVLVDTGSVGLRVFASAISTSPSAGVIVRAQRDSIQTLDGTIWSGTVASATLRIGSLATVRPVPFQIVSATSCGANPLKVTCYRGADQSNLAASGIEGILGIGLDGPGPGSPVINPLESLPGKYGQAWTLDMTSAIGPGTGALILGASPFSHPLARIQLDSIGSPQAAPAWNDEPDLCWTITNNQMCGPTILDSGSTFAYIGSPRLYTHAVSPGPGLPRLLAANQAVSISSPGGRAVFWSFDASGPGSSAVAVANARWPFLDSGEDVFLTFEVQYNIRSGTIELENPGN